MEQQAVWVTDALDVQQFDARVSFRIKVLVQVLQHIFYADLRGVSHGPDGVELQPLGDGALQNKHRRSTRTGNKIHTLRMQLRNGLREYAVVGRGEQTYAIGTYEGCLMLVDRVEDTFLQQSALVRLFAKAG